MTSPTTPSGLGSSARRACSCPCWSWRRMREQSFRFWLSQSSRLARIVTIRLQRRGSSRQYSPMSCSLFWISLSKMTKVSGQQISLEGSNVATSSTTTARVNKSDFMLVKSSQLLSWSVRQSSCSGDRRLNLWRRLQSWQPDSGLNTGCVSLNSLLRLSQYIVLKFMSPWQVNPLYCSYSRALTRFWISFRTSWGGNSCQVLVLGLTSSPRGTPTGSIKMGGYRLQASEQENGVSFILCTWQVSNSCLDGMNLMGGCEGNPLQLPMGCYYTLGIQDQNIVVSVLVGSTGLGLQQDVGLVDEFLHLLLGVGADEVARGVDYLENLGLFLLRGCDQKLQCLEDLGQLVLLDKTHEDSIDLLEVVGFFFQRLGIQRELLPKLSNRHAYYSKHLVQNAFLFLGLLFYLVRQLLVLVQQHLVLADQLHTEFLKLLLVFFDDPELLGESGLVLSPLLLTLLGALVVDNEALALERGLLAADEPQGRLLPLHEILVAVDVLGLNSVEHIADLIKVVHIKLPHEGVVIGVLEVPGQHLLAEAAQVQDHKRVLLMSPADDFPVAGVLHYQSFTERMSQSLLMKAGALSFRYLEGRMHSAMANIINGLGPGII